MIKKAVIGKNQFRMCTLQGDEPECLGCGPDFHKVIREIPDPARTLFVRKPGQIDLILAPPLH
jgi:hypothetical protein